MQLCPWHSIAAQLHTALMATPCAAPFANPVDEVADGAPGYHAAVTEPTDLGAILQRLQHQQYAMPEQYRADLDRVVANSRLYNTNQVWLTLGHSSYVLPEVPDLSAHHNTPATD